MRGIFVDPDVGDVALAQLAIGVEFAEARFDDAPFLVLEALGARHAGGGGALLLLSGCGEARLGGHAWCRGHGQGRRAIARVAVGAVRGS